MTLPNIHVSFAATPNEAGDAFTYTYELPTNTWTSGPGNEWKEISHFTFHAQCPGAVVGGTMTASNATIESWEYISSTYFKVDIDSYGQESMWALQFDSPYAPVPGIIQIKSGAGQQGSQLVTSWPGIVPGCELIPEPSTALLVLLAGVVTTLTLTRNRK